MRNPLPDDIYLRRTKPVAPDIRAEYFRDQTKIIHSYPFRRLKHKAQVFYAPDNDHICTRMEHVLHVATIAATICRGLNLSGQDWALDTELAYAIGLGHDLVAKELEHVLDHLAREEVVLDDYHAQSHRCPYYSLYS